MRSRADGQERILEMSLVQKVFLKIFYLFIHERHRKREAETQAEGEAGSMHGA